MAIATGAATAVDAIKERLTPALDTFDETIRHGRRVIVRVSMPRKMQPPPLR